MPKIVTSLKLVCLIFPLLLSSCYDVDEHVEVKADGTTDIHIRSSASERYLAIGAQKGFQFCKQAIPVPVGLKTTIERHKKLNSVICDLGVSGKTEEVFAAMQRLTIPSYQPYPDAGSSALHFFSQKDQYRITLFIVPPGDRGQISPLAQFIRALILAGWRLHYSVSAPGVVDTNGDQNPDRKTASFSVPLWKVFGYRKEAIRFEANFQKTWK